VKRPAFWRFSFCDATEKDTREEAGPVTGAAKFIDTSIARLWGVMGAREGGLADFNPTFLSGAGVLPIQGESMSSTSPPEHSDMSFPCESKTPALIRGSRTLGGGPAGLI
jgi:hypothetical protein